jgi:phenylacetate-CoA ligase
MGQRCRAVHARRRYAAGDVVHVAYGYGLFTGGLGAHYGAEKLGCTVVPVSGGMTPRQVQLIEDFGASTIMVTPSYALSILDEYREQGRDPRESPLQVGIFGAEPWTNAMRSEIEQAFDMHAVDIYGLSEVMGPGVANECVETKDGLHIWEDHFYPEVIDPVTGEVLPDGEMGELVFTSLTKEAFPIIRYRTRDLTRLLPGTARSMRRMEKVTGRSDDMIILRGVNIFPTQIEEQLMATEGLGPHFQIELTREGRMDAMTVHVEAAEGPMGSDALTAAGAALKRRIKERVGVSPSRSPPMARAASRAARARRCASSTTGRKGRADAEGPRPRPRTEARRTPPGRSGAFRRARLRPRLHGVCRIGLRGLQGIDLPLL